MRQFMPRAGARLHGCFFLFILASLTRLPAFASASSSSRTRGTLQGDAVELEETNKKIIDSAWLPDMKAQKVLGAATTAALAAAQSSNTTSDNILVPLVFKPLPLGSITPNGWLTTELQTEANGLAGHEHDFFSWVADSSWTGGSSEYSDLNEGLPYWFNGLVPLAYSLDDSRLKGQVHQVATDVLARQADDGWIGPESGTLRNFWGRFPFFLGLTQLAEANKTWEQPILDSLYKFNSLTHKMMVNNYTGYLFHDGDQLGEGDTTWGRARSQDMMITLMWLYENHPNGTENQQMLVDNLNFFYNQSINWGDWYDSAVYPFEDIWTLPSSRTEGDNYSFVHGVNVGQGLKAPAVYRRLTHNDSEITTAANAVNWTFTYHGAASGTVIADEREDGLSPWSGAELCSAVEAMYSLEYLYQALGVGDYAERAEMNAYNSMPAMLTGDWWAHQYMEQANQPYAKNLSQTPFFNSNTFAQTFGLEPNYPCCAVNHPQGLPKFLSNSYVTVGDNGLAHALLSPAAVKTTLNGDNPVTVDCSTDYPFADQLTYAVTAAKPFDFYVRVPSWAGSSSSVNSAPVSPDPQSGLHKVSLPAGNSQVTYSLASDINATPRANETVAVYRGQLLYALEIASKNTSSQPRTYNDPSALYNGAPAQAVDYSMTNASAWNYAIDPKSLVYHEGSGLGLPAFQPGSPGNYIEAKACLIDWPLYMGAVPGRPPTGSDKKCIGSGDGKNGTNSSMTTTVKLVPYGSAKLHMAELPTIDLGGM